MSSRHFLFIVVAVWSLLLSSCYEHPTGQRPMRKKAISERTMDSLSFFQKHHYTNNYNFVVRADSLTLLRQLPEEEAAGMETDSFSVRKGDHLAVADIKMMPADSIDSVWVQLANDTSAFGWTREKEMLPRVMPDDPISQFISAFSDSHFIVFLIVVAVFGTSYTLWKLFKKKAYIVHFHDIDSVYPTMLSLIVASAATFYATIQLFAPQLWQHFYFHPTLNPFSVPPVLMLFLLSVWAILIVGIACVDDVCHKLTGMQAVLYLGGLAAVCAIDYIVFSVTTLYFIGYPLLGAYIAFALYRHWRNRTIYICGNCGKPIKHKGKCPYCGAIND